MAASDRANVTLWEAPATQDWPDNIADLLLQRRAMLAMLLAMLVMALGLPLHIASLGAHQGHAAAPWAFGIIWLSGLLTLWILWIARGLLRDSWLALRHARFDSTQLVTLCALAAFGVSIPALAQPHAPMYFDVAAMSIAWVVSGQAQQSVIRRRFLSTLEQLAPLNLRPTPGAALAAPARIDRVALWVGGVILALAIAVLGWHIFWSKNLANGIVTALAMVAAGCPCTLGIARSSALVAGVERAAALGWLIPSGAVFSRIAAAPHAISQAAVAVGPADREELQKLARAVDRVARLNLLWAAGLNLALLPLAVLAPLPALLPAATMLIARLLIFCTNRWLSARVPPTS